VTRRHTIIRGKAQALPG